MPVMCWRLAGVTMVVVIVFVFVNQIHIYEISWLGLEAIYREFRWPIKWAGTLIKYLASIKAAQGPLTYCCVE